MCSPCLDDNGNKNWLPQMHFANDVQLIAKGTGKFVKNSEKFAFDFRSLTSLELNTLARSGA